MTTLRCTRKLLDRLGVPHDAESNVAPANALGDWYANLLRFGRDQFVIVVSERTALALLFPAKGVRESIVPEILRTLRWLLAELAVPEEVIDRELEAMQPMAFARTANRSVISIMNERAHFAEHGRRLGRSLAEEMLSLARVPRSSSKGAADVFPDRAARRLLGLDPQPPPPQRMARLHISLEGLSPPVWRRLVVPADIGLRGLHSAIQGAFGWQDYHLHEFEFGGQRYGAPDPDYPDAGLRVESGVRLQDALAASGVDRFTYRYDFGDDWSHEVVVEAVEPNTEGARGVSCIGGANKCPPEDVGGPPGYLEFLQAVRDPAHEQHSEMLALAGGRFDPAEFDLELVNMLLRVRG